MNLKEIRQKYPEYSDMSDDEFASKFHSKFYSDMDFKEFSNKVGYTVTPEKEKTGEIADKLGTLGKRVAGSFLGDLAAAGDYVAGIPKMGAQALLQVGGMLAGHDSALAEKASQNAIEDVFPSFASSLNKLPEGYREGSQGAYQALMAPMEGLTQVLGLPGKAVEALGGDPNLVASTNLATNIGAMAAPVVKDFAKPGQVLPEGAKAGPGFAAPMTESIGFPFRKTEVPTNFSETAPKQPAPDPYMEKVMGEQQVNAPDQGPLKIDISTGPIHEARQLDLNLLSPEERIKAMREQASAEAEGIYRDYQQTTPQGDLFAGPGTKQPSPYDRVKEQEMRGESLPYEGPGLSEGIIERASPTEALKTTHDYPTVEFPLRQEVLEHPEIKDAINNFRRQADELQQVADNAINPKVRENAKEQLTRLQEEFQRGMDLLGIQKPSDAYGRGLYEARGNETTGTVQHTFTPERPIGQTGFGKGQRGSIGFFGETPQEKYTKQMQKQYPNATPEQIQKAWDMKQQEAGKVIEGQKQTQQQSAAFAKATGIDPKRTGEILPTDKLIDVASTVGDIKDRSIFTEQVASSGRLQRDLLDHPVTTQIYNVTNKFIEESRQTARHVLDDTGIGVIPKIRNIVMTAVNITRNGVKLTGQQQMMEYMKWRFANEGKSTTLPDTFGPRVKEIHEMLNKADQRLLTSMNEVITAQGGKPIDGINNHLVHYWDGPYRAHIYVKGPNDSAPRLAFYVAEKSMADAQAAMKWIKENVKYVDQDATKGVQFIKSDARSRSSMFDVLLQLSNETDPTVNAALASFKERVEKGESNYLGEQHRQDVRKGVQGFLGNKPWLSEKRNYSDTIDSIRTKYDAGFQWVAAQKIKMQMSELLKAQQEGKLAAGNALSLGQKYIDHALGRNVDTSSFVKLADYIEEANPKFGSLRRGTNTALDVMGQVTIPWLLMLKGSQAAQGVYQVFQATIPKMLHDASLDNASSVHIPKALAGGFLDGATNFVDVLTLGKFTDAKAQLYEAIGKEQSPISKAIQQAVSDYDISRMSLTDVGAGREGGFAKSWANQFKESLLNAPMNLIESPTRTWAFSSYVRQAVANGHDINTAINLARESMDTMTNYNPEGQSMMFGNMGMVGQQARGLHTFMINYYTQLANYTKVAAKQKNPVPLLSYLALTYAAGGAVGFIGRDLADWLLDGVKSAARGTSMDTPEFQKFSVKGWMLDNLPDWASVGPMSASTGVGLYGSFTSKVVDPDRSFLENLLPKASAAVDIGKSVVKSPKLFREETTQREKGQILEGMAPKVFTQMIRNKYQNKDGVVYDTSEKSPGLPVYKRTPKEQAISENSLGLRGLGEVMASDRMSDYYKGQKNIQESSKAILLDFDKKIIAAAKNGTPTEFQKTAIKRIANDLVDKWGVSGEQLQSRVEKLAIENGLPDNVVRKLYELTKKEPKRSDVQKIQELTGMSRMMKQRQENYGR